MQGGGGGTWQRDVVTKEFHFRYSEGTFVKILPPIRCHEGDRDLPTGDAGAPKGSWKK